MHSYSIHNIDVHDIMIIPNRKKLIELIFKNSYFTLNISILTREHILALYIVYTFLLLQVFYLVLLVCHNLNSGQVKSVKPALKQLQQSIQNITQLSEQGMCFITIFFSH